MAITEPYAYPGYQRFFSRAVGIFGVGRVTIKTWQKPESALEKSLAPRVPYAPNEIMINKNFLLYRRQYFLFVSELI